MITIVLADDHHVVRQGIRSLLEREPDFQVIGETADGLEVAQLVETLHPDILVLDLMMRDINGIDIMKVVSKRSPSTGVVILSMYGNEAYVLEALRAGAKAYVLKESSADELVRAIHEAAVGHRYLSSPLSEQAIEEYVRKTKDTGMDSYDTLTNREREVLHMAVQGCTNADIATRLYISRRTVETHRANMMRKLDIHTQTDLVRYALQQGILPPDS